MGLEKITISFFHSLGHNCAVGPPTGHRALVFQPHLREDGEGCGEGSGRPGGPRHLDSALPGLGGACFAGFFET